MSDTGVHISSWRTRIGGFWPLGPIFSKELRQMARRRRSYWLRFGYLGLLLLILLITWYGSTESYRRDVQSIVEQAQSQAAMGRYFFIAFSLFSISAMLLIGPVLTSTAIGSERLTRTLDVLLMTPISSWQIVTGKLFSRTFSAIVLIGLTLPVLAIVRLLGGVEISDMFGVLAYCACTVTAAAALGLLFSCWLKRAWTVILLSYMIMIAAYAIIPFLIILLLEGIIGRSSRAAAMWVMESICATNPVAVTVTNCVPGTRYSVDWYIGCVIQLAIAVALTAFASVIVRRIHRKESAGELAVQPVTAPTFIYPSDAFPAPAAQQESESRVLNYHVRQTPRYSGKYPVLLHEISRPLLTRPWQRLTATSLVVGMLLLSYIGFTAIESSALSNYEIQIGYAFVMTTLIWLICNVLASTAIATEKESDTWTLLIVSPVTASQVLWGKYAGVARRMFWPFMLIVGHFALFALTGVITIQSFLMMIWITVTFNSVWIASGVYLSLRSKKVTMAVALNLILAIAVYAAAPMVMAVASVNNRASFDASELCSYWHPFWYFVEGICSYSKLSVTTMRLPAFNESVGRPVVFIFAFLAGLAHLLLAGLIMYYACRRFDKLVDRAPQVDATR